jgi:hypothetical protein
MHMRSIAILGLALVLGASACASAERVQVAAQRHEAAAAEARSSGDYDRAMDEQAAADKQWRKAYNRGGGLPPVRTVTVVPSAPAIVVPSY